MITCDKEIKNKQFIHMFQFHVSHVSGPCGYFILVILLPCCHVSWYKKLRLHSHVTPLLFTTLKYETYTIGKCCICMFR